MKSSSSSSSSSKFLSSSEEAAVDLGTRYAVMRRRYIELEKVCDNAVKETKELRLVIDQILEQKGGQTAMDLNLKERKSVGVQCDLMNFLGQHNIEGIERKIDVPPKQRNFTSLWKLLFAAVRQAKALYEMFSSLGNRQLVVDDEKFSFLFGVNERRRNPDYLIDSSCISGLDQELCEDEKLMDDDALPEFEIGQLFIFKDYAEFVSPVQKSIDSEVTFHSTIIKFDKVVAIEQKIHPFKNNLKPMNEKSLYFNVHEVSSNGPEVKRTAHTFWDVGKSNLDSCLLVLKEQMQNLHIGKLEIVSSEFSAPNSDISKVIIMEHERKAANWSSKNLIAPDPPVFCDLKGKAHPGPDNSLMAPSGYSWITEKWIIESSECFGKVLEIFPDSPSEVSGLLSEDFILSFETQKAPQDSEKSLSFSLFPSSLKLSSNSALILTVYRASTSSFFNFYNRPFEWNGKGYGFRYNRLDGWSYAKSFQGPWTLNSSSNMVRRRKWIRYAKRLPENSDQSSLEFGPFQSQSTPASSNDSLLIDSSRVISTASALFGEFTKSVESLGAVVYRKPMSSIALSSQSDPPQTLIPDSTQSI
jgi:hypothetical protein